jgi:alcohol dehydrogenase (NADP+)
MIPGHEIVGIVEEVGPNVTHYVVGDKVGVGCFVDSCRKCDPCLKGLQQY